MGLFLSLIAKNTLACVTQHFKPEYFLSLFDTQNH